MKLKISKQEIAEQQALLTPQQAIGLINVFIENRRQRTHTMELFFGCLLGCNMDLKQIKAVIKTNIGLSLSNTVGGHEVAVKRADGKGWLFLETNADKVLEL